MNSYKGIQWDENLWEYTIKINLTWELYLV